MALGDADFLQLTEQEATELGVIVDELLGVVEDLNTLWADRENAVDSPERWAGRRPTRDENPWNAFVWICDVEGATEGPLSGLLVGVKDNLDVAGLPTSNGSSLNPYRAGTDATVVERLLEAGARIVGKLNLDNYSSGGTGETSVFGPPRNPLNPKHTAGGSSGGSGAALASGAVDLALGVDQAGSARIPASFCGTVALKATHGTIPTFGVTHLDHTLDAICPMARSVNEAELLYTAVAGPDWRDPQWLPEREHATSNSLRSYSPEEVDITQLRFAVVIEGVDPTICSSQVLTTFTKSIEALEFIGAHVEEMSIPLWTYGYPIARPLLCHLVQAIVESEGEGYGHFGFIDVERMHKFATNRRSSGKAFPPNTKAWILAGRYLHEKYLNRSFALAQNLRLALREEIKEALTSVDCLLTPTTPFTAPMLGERQLSVSQLVRQTVPVVAHNTAGVNLSGHPALALPNGEDDHGLATSIQLVGNYFAEPLLFAIGRFLERETPYSSPLAATDLAAARTSMLDTALKHHS